MPSPSPHRVRAGLAGVLVGLLTVATLSVLEAPAQAAGRKAANVATPGDFTGYGFDQCLAPTQATMDRWLQSSPFLAVGIYISGASRACRDQPNLTPAWIRTQLARGWRLLPITLGPQASCLSRFPRYGNDPTIRPRPGPSRTYPKAMAQGRTEAGRAVAAATRLGISPGSTLWYDLEGFDNTRRHCRESALTFLSGWSDEIRKLGYVSGVYSSAGSGMAELDKARINRPDRFHLPDQIWVARWDGVANTSTSYLRDDGWRPHARVKQYRGGHDERWGGVTINIDSNYLDVGRGSIARKEVRCGGTRVSYPSYAGIVPPLTATDPKPPRGRVMALQCLLTEQGYFKRPITGSDGKPTRRAVHRWQADRGLTVRDIWSRKNWMTAHVVGRRPVLKIGSAGPAARRLQRALNASSTTVSVRVTGVFDVSTDQALRGWQRRTRTEVSGVAGTTTWRKLAQGAR